MLRTALLPLVLVLLVLSGCATGDDTTIDAHSVLERNAQTPAVDALPDHVDMVARVPLADTGGPITAALFPEQTFDPHLYPYSPPEEKFSTEALAEPFHPDSTPYVEPSDPHQLREGEYACPEHRDLVHHESVPCPHCGEDFVAAEEIKELDSEHDELVNIDEDDWIRWAETNEEWGARLLLSTLLQGAHQRRRMRQIRRFAGPHDHNPLPPLDLEDVTGDAWIGYAVDDDTRRFFDYADPASARGDDDQEWIPHISAIIAIPITSAARHQEQFELLCLDDRHDICDRIVDVRSEDELLVIELITEVGGDQFDELFEDHDVSSQRSGLLDRVGHDEPTAAMAAFLSNDGPGYYMRTDGLRRIAAAQYLIESYDAEDGDYDRLATMMRALRTRVFGDIDPIRDDVAVIADIGDDGLAVDSISSHVDGADDIPDDYLQKLPAFDVDDDYTTIATWRIAAADIDSAAGTSRWDISSGHIEDHIEWLQGALFAAVDRPVGLDSLLMADGIDIPRNVRRQLPGHLVDLIEVMTTSADELTESEDELTAELASLVRLLTDGGPDSAAIRILEAPPRGADDEPTYALGGELYFDDPDVAEPLRPIARSLTSTARAQSTDVELYFDVVDGEDYAALRIGADLPPAAFGDSPTYGAAGGQFDWLKLSGEPRQTLDHRFQDSFEGVFAPESIRWNPFEGNNLSGRSLRIGAADTPPALPDTEVTASAPQADEAAVCTAAAQAEIAALFDAGEHRQMGVDEQRRELQEKQRQARRIQRAFAGGDVDVDDVGEALRALEMPVHQALLTARHHATFGANLDDVVQSLRDCADDHPNTAKQLNTAADNWKRWGEDLLDTDKQQ